jgi:hypothetical protein
VSCTDPTKVSQLAAGLKNGVTFDDGVSVVCGGYTWQVFLECADNWYGSVDGTLKMSIVAKKNGGNYSPIDFCACEYSNPTQGPFSDDTYSLRITDTYNWGGIKGGSCGQESQTIQVEFL